MEAIILATVAMVLVHHNDHTLEVAITLIVVLILGILIRKVTEVSDMEAAGSIISQEINKESMVQEQKDMAMILVSVEEKERVEVENTIIMINNTEEVKEGSMVMILIIRTRIIK